MNMENDVTFTPAIFISRGEKESCACEAPESVQHSRDGEAHIWFDACDGAQAVNVSATCGEAQMPGRVLDVTATLRNVCPGRRSAVGMTLSEVDESGAEYARGFRSVSVPAHHGHGSRDVQLEKVRFILPEDVSLQRKRHFICRLTHHYMDADSIWD